MRLLNSCLLAFALVVTPIVNHVGEAETMDARQSVAIWPRPQQQTARHDGFRLPRMVGLVRGPHADDNAERVVRDILTAAGVQEVRADRHLPVVVWLGDGNEALARLDVPNAQGLPAGGYVLAAGQGQIVLDGVDADGTFYAAQSLRQVVQHGQVPGVAVRDWPDMQYRGSIEGFYGTPWSHAERLSHLDYLGAHKMNTYEYAPKDDPYHRGQWRDPYPPDKLAQLGELITRARANRIHFTFALSPGLSICYSSDQDLTALLAKFESIYALGGRSFNVPLDDIDPNTWHCDTDQAKFGNPGNAAAGQAQAYLLNRVEQWVRDKGDVAPLQMVPTEYYTNTDSPYKQALRTQLSQDVIVHWTGVGVVPGTITDDQAAQARAVFGHQLLLWDNYPVNDYIAGRLPMAAYVGRQTGLSKQLSGIVSNPSNQPTVSQLALFSYADFTWHDQGYDPDEAWHAAIAEATGGDRRTEAALAAFADLNTYDSTLHQKQAPVLAGQNAQFWARWDNDPRSATAHLRSYVDDLTEAPDRIRATMPNPAFAAEAKAWLDAAELWSRAQLAAVNMLDAQAHADGAEAWSQRQRIQPLIDQALSIRDTRLPHSNVAPKVGDGVIDTFIAQAKAKNDAWLGLPPRPTPMTSLGTWQDNVPNRMLDDDQNTYYYADRSVSTGDYIGVDLGQQHELGDIDIQMTTPQIPNDYLHQGILEYSADGVNYSPLTTGNTTEIRFTPPPGTKARYVRYRATADQIYWVVVREFLVKLNDVPEVTGTPTGRLTAASDNNLDTWYRATTPPQPGDALTITAPKAQPLARVLVFASPETRARIEVRTDGTWRPVGELRRGYAELRTPRGIPIDAVRLDWAPGSPAPAIADVILR